MARTGRPRTAERELRICEWCGIEYERAVWENGRERFHAAECYHAWKARNAVPREPKPKVSRVCTFIDEQGVPCPKPFKGRGYCETHLLRFRKYGDAGVVLRGGPRPSTEPRPICSIDGCEEPVNSLGLCTNHYNKQHRRGGDPAVDLPRGNFSTPVSTRSHMFTQGGPDECWEWQGSTNKNGYGITGLNGKVFLAHRAVYLELVGPIGDDEEGNPLQLDHLCANKICVNPNHLDPCTWIDNLNRRGGPHFELRGKTAKVTWEEKPEPHQVTIGPKVHV